MDLKRNTDSIRIHTGSFYFRPYGCRRRTSSVNGSVYFPDQPYQRRAVCRYKFNYPGCGLSEIALTLRYKYQVHADVSFSVSKNRSKDYTLAASCLRIWNNRRNLFGGFNGKGRLSYFYMLGLIAGPIFGWSFGTALGAFTSSALPESLSNAMVLPCSPCYCNNSSACKKSRPVLMIVLISVAIIWL